MTKELLKLRDKLIHHSICKKCNAEIEGGINSVLCFMCEDKRDSIMFVFDELLSELKEARRE